MKKLFFLLALIGIGTIGYSKDEVDKDNRIENIITPNPRYCLYYTSSDGEIVIPYVSSSFNATILSNTYKDGVGVIEFNAPITSIGEAAFYDCKNLTNVTIPDSVTMIGDEAFDECISLTSITIPDSVTMIGDWAFHDCRCLASVTIGDGVTMIGDYAFDECISLKSITVPDSVTMIGDCAFSECRCLTSVTIGDSVTMIGDDAFYDCRCLTCVTIGDSVTMIGNHAFYNCSRLTSVYCKSTAPPEGYYGMFDYNASGCTIYVPMQSVSAYKKASYWWHYSNAIVGYNY